MNGATVERERRGFIDVMIARGEFIFVICRGD